MKKGLIKDIYKFTNDIKLFEFVMAMNKDTPLGRYEFDGGYVNIFDYQTKDEECKKLECHKYYTDIQCVLLGKEKIYYSEKLNDRLLGDYNLEGDCQMYEVIDKQEVVLNQGQFLEIEPNVLHMAGFVDGDKCYVKKAVVKIKK